MNSIYICLKCKGEMNLNNLGNLFCVKCGLEYKQEKDVFIALPESMNELSQKEADYHDNHNEDPEDAHQLKTYRVKKIHQFITRKIESLPKDSLILEIGAGYGMDAKKISQTHKVFLTDISKESLKTIGKNKNIELLAADASNLPLKKEQFDCVYMVATFHHFLDNKDVLGEIYRVLKPGGLIVFGIEPNKFYFSKIKKFRKFLIWATHMKGEEVSHADEEMDGYSKRDIKKIFNSKEYQNLEIYPVWFLSGFLHYFLEFIYRVFKLKKRIELNYFEKIIYNFDNLILRLPFLKFLCWHWTWFLNKRY